MALQCPLQEGAVVQMGDVSPGLARSCQHGTGVTPVVASPWGPWKESEHFHGFGMCWNGNTWWFKQQCPQQQCQYF